MKINSVSERTIPTFWAFVLLFGLIGVFIVDSYSSNKAQVTNELRPSDLSATSTKPLVDLSIAGVRKKTIGDKDIAEIIGWVAEIDEENNLVELYQPGAPFSHTILVPQATVIRKAFENEEGKLDHELKTFYDLVPERTRVVILCEDIDCSEALIVSIIEER